jgi:hypothetical protein
MAFTLDDLINLFPSSTPPMTTPENDPTYNERREEAMRWAEEQLEAANMLGTREGEAMRPRLIQQRMRELMGE